jgi:hypothetical protein
MKQSSILKKINFCISRFVIASALLLSVALYLCVVKGYLKAPQFAITSIQVVGASADQPKESCPQVLDGVCVKNTQELIALFDTYNYALDLYNKKQTITTVPAIYFCGGSQGIICEGFIAIDFGCK